MNKQLITGLAIGVGTLSLPSCNLPQKKEETKPNLIFVFTDQQSFDMLGSYGNKQIITPHLDRFASQGVQFNHAVVNCPVCTPARGTLLSGMHPLYNGAMHNDIQMLPGNGNHFGEVLRDAGYHTGYYGKWHLYGGDRVRPIPPGPLRYGFDEEFLSNNCTLVFDSLRSYFWNENNERELYGEWEWNAQTKQALEFIDNHADKPMALFLSWHAPHDWSAGGVREHKYSAPVAFEKLYDPDEIILRENVEETPLRRRYYQGHMAMITSLDEDFGRILAKLEEKEIAENSLIVFTSDHGDMLESHNWPFNKGRPEIESIKVPLIMKWAGQLIPRQSELLFGWLDLMPTILGLMGLPVPETTQGVNLAEPILKQQDDAVESVPLFYFAGDWRGVYTHDYTYAFSLPSGAAEPHAINRGFPNYNVLFDHHNDRYQLNNLYDHPDYAELKKKLHNMSLEWMEFYNDQGVPFRLLFERAAVEEDHEMYWRPHVEKEDNWDMRLKGRPVDFQ